MLHVLLADEHPTDRAELAELLRGEGHDVREAAEGVDALTLAANHPFDLVICDVLLPKIDALTVLERLRRMTPGLPVVMLSAAPKLGQAMHAFRAGALDYVIKPIDRLDFCERIVDRLAQRCAVARERDEARAELAGESGASALVGRSVAIVQLREQIELLAQGDVPRLWRGESGVGKEIVGRMLHERGPRRERPFVAFNCAAVPEGLLEAELFGHERGAFTGADRRRDGRFKAADGGTLLLDEIAEIPPSSQAKLLRVLEERRVEPLGCNRSLPVDVRIVSATHQDLKHRIADGRFRQDLYYRLNGIDLRIAPLRERREDLPLLVEHFLARATPPGRAPPAIRARAWEARASYSLPGNVRELEHAVERAVVLARGGEIDLECLPPDVVDEHEPPCDDARGFEPLPLAVRRFEREHLARALRLAAGKKAHAAALLGISP